MIYLDNSATTKQYPQVTELMMKCMTEDFGNPSALYRLGVDGEKIVKKARKQILDASDFSASGKEFDVVFTSGGTEADNMAIFGSVKSLARRGRRIVTSAVEHPAVLECCNVLEQQGFDIIKVGVDRKCRINRDELEAAINEETILVTLMHVNNEVGTVMPLRETRDIMRKKGAPGLLHCDAVQSFGKMPLPDCADLISLSGHKIHGPKGSGALLVRRGKSPSGKKISVPPYILGGGQEKGLRSGTENVPAIAGIGKAAELCADNMLNDMESVRQLRGLLIGGLKAGLKDVAVNSPEDAGDLPGQCCGSLLSVSFEGTRGEVILHTLEQDDIYVSTGSACSSNKKGQSQVLKAMGMSDSEIEGTIRFSLGRFNTEEDIEITIDRTIKAVNRFRRLGSFR